MGKEYKKFSKSFRLLVFEKTNGRCWYCGWKFPDIRYMQTEHMENEGGDRIENIFPSCNVCNLRKGTSTLEIFRERLSNPKFTEVQIEFFERNNIFLPENPIRVIFYGETLDGR